VDSNTRSIVELAWARQLRLPEHALLDPYPERVLAVRDDAVMFVQLWQHTVLLAPERVLARAAHRDSADLTAGSVLLDLARGTGQAGARLVGRSELAFTDRYVEGPDPDEALVTDDPETVAELERRCPPDDVAEVGLSRRGWQLAALDGEALPVAGAGFDEWQHIIAHVKVLAAADRRRRGWGWAAGALAVNEALDRGLVPQWRASTSNKASRALGRRLGFEVVGSQTTVLLSP
jgi:hypothetical protein